MSIKTLLNYVCQTKIKYLIHQNKRVKFKITDAW